MPYVGLPTCGDPLSPSHGEPTPPPVNFLIPSRASGTPIDANRVPKKPPDCDLVGFILTPEPI